MFFHVLSCSFMFFHVRSCSFMFVHVRSCSFMFVHVLSFSFIFFHVGCSKSDFFLGLNFVTISINTSYKKNQFLGPSRGRWCVCVGTFEASFPLFSLFLFLLFLPPLSFSFSWILFFFSFFFFFFKKNVFFICFFLV